MNREKLDLKEQRSLKRLDKGHRILCSAILWGIYLLAALMLVMAVYYGISEANGSLEGKNASNYFGGFLVFAAAGASVTLLNMVLRAIERKENQFDPQKMILPPKGTVTLDTALHHMAIKTGVIAWDTIFGVMLGSLLLLMLCLGGNIPLILLICLILTLFLVAGHLFWSYRWKRRSFSDKMLQNTKSFIPIENPSAYAAKVEKSLMNGVLYYGKELILTEDFIIGMIVSDITFMPVAIPRAEISRLVFFCRKPVMNRYRKYETGILDCRLYSGKSAELLVGQGPRINRALKILSFYHIEWKLEDTVYE